MTLDMHVHTTNLRDRVFGKEKTIRGSDWNHNNEPTKVRSQLVFMLKRG